MSMSGKLPRVPGRVRAGIEEKFAREDERAAARWGWQAGFACHRDLADGELSREAEREGRHTRIAWRRCWCGEFHSGMAILNEEELHEPDA